MWFLAELVLEFRVEGDERNAVHVDSVLVEADTPAHAWHAAVELGLGAEHRYRNTEGREVAKAFRGVRGLRVLWEGVGHGAEILSEEHVQVPEERLREWTGPREDLEAFRPDPERAPPGPNLMPGDLSRLWLAGRRPEG